jgi:hypothetical protein
MDIIRELVRLSTACLFVCVISCHAQNTTVPLLEAKGLQADLSILRKAYESLHPGLYRYNSKPQMDLAFADLSHKLERDETLQDAFLAFSEFAAKVRCGHTQANPFNQSDEVIEKLFKTPTRVPFYFQWLDERMIVSDDFTPNHLFPKGTEIVSINGASVQGILTKLMTITRADGGNDTKRVAQLEVVGNSEYETFDIYHPMFFPLSGKRIKFAVRLPGSRRLTWAWATPLTFEQRIAPIKQREKERKGGSDVLFEAKQLAGGSVYIKMRSWALYNSKWDWKSWLNERLDSATESRAPALILDIRGNEGGDDVGKEILPHLVDAPIVLSPMQRLVRYRKVPDDLVPYLDTWDKSFRDWGSAAIDLPTPWPTAPQGVPYLELNRDDDEGSGDVIKPTAKRFQGKVIVLIDATNSSATFQFAQSVQAHHLGVLIGQPTGGSLRGINGGAFFFVRLPHSGIEMDLPLIGSFPPTAMPDGGFSPDILVSRTALDVVNGRDPELDAALALAHQN